MRFDRARKAASFAFMKLDCFYFAQHAAEGVKTSIFQEQKKEYTDLLKEHHRKFWEEIVMR